MKKTIKETVREYDADGKLVKETITETTEEAEDKGITISPTIPYTPPYEPSPIQPPWVWTSTTTSASDVKIDEGVNNAFADNITEWGRGWRD